MRHFEIHNEKHGETGGWRKVAHIVCGECGRRATLPIQTGQSVLPDEAVQKKFLAIDWQVGPTEKKDMCPECSRKERNGKMTHHASPPLTPKMNGSIGGTIPSDAAVASLKKITEPLAQAILQKTEERQMGREERRAIYDVIAAHYPKGGNAYDRDWSDQRIATETKMPRKWVEDVRATFFGEHGGNPEMQEYLEEFRKLHADAVAILQRAAEVRKTVDLILGDHLFANVQQILDRQAALDKLADKVRKHIVS